MQNHSRCCSRDICCLKRYRAELLWNWRVCLVSPCRRWPFKQEVIPSDAFCLFYDAKTKEVKALNGSGHSPQKLTVDYVRKHGITGRSIPLTDLNSVTVPGMLAIRMGPESDLTPV